MAKVSFAKLGLKVVQDVKNIKVNDIDIEVKQYLPAQEKYNLLLNTIEKSYVNGVLDDFKLELYFHLNMIYAYTNILFTDKQKEDEFKLYDMLDSNDIIDEVIDAISEEEYNSMFDMLGNMLETKMDKDSSIASVINNIVAELPAQLDAAAQAVSNFDPKQYQAVIDFANAANGGRDFITNKPIDK